MNNKKEMVATLAAFFSFSLINQTEQKKINKATRTGLRSIEQEEKHSLQGHQGTEAVVPLTGAAPLMTTFKWYHVQYY